jgi:hypothetical protein
MKATILMCWRSIQREVSQYRRETWRERWDHLVHGGAGKWGGGVPPT